MGKTPKRKMTKSFHDFRRQILEVLSVSDGIETWIRDFIDSDNPKFTGKSKEKRREMAIAAFLAKKRES